MEIDVKSTDEDLEDVEVEVCLYNVNDDQEVECWEADDKVDAKKLDPVFLFEGNNPREEMKQKYFVDFFISAWTEGASGDTFLDFFQTDRDDIPMGI